MKGRKQISNLIIIIFLTLNYSICVPDVSATFPSSSDQFIGEIFPNCTLPLGLSHSNTIITVNATKSLKNVGITFDANYTIYNPENTTTITVIVPFSLAFNITTCTIEVYANNTQIPNDLISIPTWNENITEINIDYLPGPFVKYPITLIKSNLTLLKNSTSVIRYHFSGALINPLDSEELFYITYYLGTWQDWKGNTTGRLEYRAYGKEPVFTTRGHPPPNTHPLYVDINGGKSFSYEWSNIRTPYMNIGVRYYRELTPFEEFLNIIGWEIVTIRLIYISIPIIIIGLVIIRKKRKKRKLQNSL